MLHEDSELVELIVECTVMQQVGIVLVMQGGEVESWFILEIVVELERVLG